MIESMINPWFGAGLKTAINSSCYSFPENALTVSCSVAALFTFSDACLVAYSWRTVRGGHQQSKEFTSASLFSNAKKNAWVSGSTSFNTYKECCFTLQQLQLKHPCICDLTPGELPVPVSLRAWAVGVPVCIALLVAWPNVVFPSREYSLVK